jgi:predicted metal-dependent HD superfamily phosphohydrolase
MNNLKNQENQENLKLEKDFIGMLSQLSQENEKVETVYKKLVTLYSSEGRYYHTLKHIQAMLRFLEERKERITNFKALFLATWYHDAIYNSQSKTNELDSAEMMKQDLVMLGIDDEELIQVIRQLILATQKHQPMAGNTDCDIFLDGDLSILSRSEHVYAVYTSNIRKEYSWVPEDEYKKGRRSVLENFLQRDRIYFSENMEQAEIVARKNLREEISQLS